MTKEELAAREKILMIESLALLICASLSFGVWQHSIAAGVFLFMMTILVCACVAVYKN